MMSVGFFDVRAISIALFTAIVVVPAPPLTPKNDNTQLARVPSFGLDRSAGRGGWPRVNDSSMGQAEVLVGAGAHGLQNLLGLRRTRQSRRSWPTATMRGGARWRSVLAPWRMSTIVSDGGFAVAWRSSTSATDVPDARRHFVTCARKSVSVLEMRTVSCAMGSAVT